MFIERVVIPHQAFPKKGEGKGREKWENKIKDGPWE